MKLTTKERCQMAGMMTMADAKLREMPPTEKLSAEQKALVNRLCEVRTGLREILALA